MKVFVDKLPKSCWECPCFKNDLEFPCGLSDGTQDYFLDEIEGGNCPLKTIEDYKTEDKALKKLLLFEKNFNVLKLNDRLADCIIKVTENIFDSDTLKLFEDLAREFYSENLKILQEISHEEKQSPN